LAGFALQLPRPAQPPVNPDQTLQVLLSDAPQPGDRVNHECVGNCFSAVAVVR